jgi:hypothetical protein
VKSRNIVLAIVGAGLALGGVVAPAASADTPGEPSVQSVTRKSAKCDSPSSKKINVSYGSGAQTTTVYFNNHCDENRALSFAFNGFGGTTIWQCIVAPAKTKSKKKIDFPNPKGLIINGTHC